MLESADIAGQTKGFSERVSVRGALPGDVKPGAVVWAGSNHGKPRSEVHASPKAQGFEWSQTLVVVHGQDPIEVLERARAEETIGGEGSVGLDAAGLRLLNGGGNDALLFVAHHAVVAGVGIQSQHRNAGGGQAKITNEAVIHELELGANADAAQARSHVFQGDMAGDHADPQSVAAEQHQHLIHASFTGQVLGVAWELKARLADGVFVDGRGDKHVHRGFCEVPHGHF